MTSPDKIRRQQNAAERRSHEQPCIECGHNTVQRHEQSGKPRHKFRCPDKPAPVTSKPARKKRRRREVTPKEAAKRRKSKTSA